MEPSAGMVTSDWINLVSSILVGGGTLFLGIMALRTIRQTRSIQMLISNAVLSLFTFLFIPYFSRMLYCY